MHTLCVALLAASLIAQPGDVPPFVRDNVRTLTFYYKSPDATIGPKLLKDLLRKESLNHPWFAGKEHVLDLIAAQIGDIGASHAKIVREYEGAFAETTPAGRRIVVRALMNCGDKETAKQVENWLADKENSEIGGELKALKQHLANAKRLSVRDRPVREPKELDMLWANFFITGEYAPVSRILDVFHEPDAPGNATLKRVAKWSFGSNLQQHPKLVEVVEAHKKDRQAGSRKVIDELILTRG